MECISLTWLISLWAHGQRQTGRGRTVLSVVSHYRDALSFYSICPIMALHPHLLKSICFYLMPQLFPDALFFTLNTNLSIHLFFLSPLSSPGWVATCPLSPPPHWTCKQLLTTGCRVISPPEILALFLSLLLFFFFYLRLEQRDKHSIAIDLETYNFYWRSHLITKADLL